MTDRPRPAKGPWPYRNHRTVEEVEADEIALFGDVPGGKLGAAERTYLETHRAHRRVA